MGSRASQITSLTIVYSAVYSGADQRKHQRSASLAFVRGIHRGPMKFPHKWPTTRKMFPFDDAIMKWASCHRGKSQWRACDSIVPWISVTMVCKEKTLMCDSDSQDTVGCNYLSLPFLPASDTILFIYHFTAWSNEEKISECWQPVGSFVISGYRLSQG